jgi:hypothetical protein
MFFKSSKTKMFDNNDENGNNDFNPRNRAQSTSHLLSPDYGSMKSISPKQDRSTTPSSASSTSSPATGNSPKTNASSYLKFSSPNHKASSSSPPEDHFVMTIIRSPSTSSQRMQANEPVGATQTNEELSNNNKYFKSKVTAALNHMKYRKFEYLFAF